MEIPDPVEPHLEYTHPPTTTLPHSSNKKTLAIVGGGCAGTLLFGSIALVVVVAIAGSALSNCKITSPPITGVSAPSARLINMAISPDGTTAYAVDSGPGNVDIIDLGSHSIIGSVKVGGSPTGIAITPDGKQLWVTSTNVNNSSGYVSVVDTASHSIAAKIPVGSGPTGIAITPDGTSAYVANTGYLTSEGSVSVINVQQLEVIDSISVGYQPTGIAISPDGTQVWVSNSAIFTLFGSSTGIQKIISSQTSSSLAEASTTSSASIGADTLPTSIATTSTNVDPTDSFPGPGSVDVIDRASDTVTATINVGQFPLFLQFSQDGNNVYVATKYPAANGCNVDAIDSKSFAVRSIATAGCPFDIAVASNGILAYSTSGDQSSFGSWLGASSASSLASQLLAPISNNIDNTVDAINLFSGIVTTINLPADANPTGIVLSLDNRWAYVADGNNGSIYVIDTLTNAVASIITIPAPPVPASSTTKSVSSTSSTG
ncbi:MAG TPA: hypothetical protein VMU77_07945 [Acidimicrobiales bacterium]|nr:hypothetical protein [Acidimicrobiales bacterium]